LDEKDCCNPDREHVEYFKLKAVIVTVIQDCETNTEGEMLKTPVDEELTSAEKITEPTSSNNCKRQKK